MKQVQISETLFTDLVKYHLGDIRDLDLEERIHQGLQEKFDRSVRRDLYRKFHDETLSPEERERCRQEYLDMVGILPDWRW